MTSYPPTYYGAAGKVKCFKILGGHYQQFGSRESPLAAVAIVIRIRESLECAVKKKV